MTELPIYVGWDSREPEAYDVCRHSLKRHARNVCHVVPLVQNDLRARGLYRRKVDPLASTEFTYTRFLVPHLVGYDGWAIFCDGDFLWTRDIGELYNLRDDRYAVMCVQHDYQPTEQTKMDGKIQTVYPRKNWSSLMLLNCAHPSTRRLTVDVVNEKSGAYLHRLQWATDNEIGALDRTWNWLEGWYPKPQHGLPGAIHYTRGGPWFASWGHVDYADEWFHEHALTQIAAQPER